ncbi:MAG: Pyrroline-5-carboxylate reductase [Alphaproteobacteria bacterium MarineAlpha8_Bin1]|nr:MAG: Pyrroline-5-carboxylate reductase [Alphaproteobacteria bacterium MarineAlpha8_Bin1]|tara:strand:+ start:433 stop:1251 length:819 start_codon:yes stop_codon:yes gene_type:complete
MNESLLLGCGNLGRIILDGFLSNSMKISVYEKNQKIQKTLKKLNKRNLEIIDNLDGLKDKTFKYILLCVKPIDSLSLIKEINTKISTKFIFVSFVAGLETKKISETLKKNKVIRMMPNILVEVGSSATGVYTKSPSKIFKKEISNNFSFFGFLEWLKEEEKMNFYTALYGGGPAYIFYFLEILNKISCKNGFSKKRSQLMVESLLHGTSKLIKNNSQNFSDIIEKVTSKGGTTEKAIEFMKKEKTYEKINNGIRKASVRSKNITKLLNLEKL